MKTITTANGQKKIKLSKNEWEIIGKKAGWIKTSKNTSKLNRVSQGRPQWSNNETKDSMIQKTIIKGLNDLLQQTENTVRSFVSGDLPDGSTQEGQARANYEKGVIDISNAIRKMQSEIKNGSNPVFESMYSTLSRL